MPHWPHCHRAVFLLTATAVLPAAANTSSAVPARTPCFIHRASLRCMAASNKAFASRALGGDYRTTRDMSGRDAPDAAPLPDSAPKLPRDYSVESKASGRSSGAPRTKFGRRERRSSDRANKNARVRHSYLKLVMDDAVLEGLHRLVRQVGKEWDGEDATDDANFSPRAVVSKKQSRRRLAIKPRSRASLHMTYFFAGQVLGRMPGEELRQWESLVRKRVLEHNLLEFSGEYSLAFKSLTTFPPRRQNLIVAVFDPSPALDDLYQKLCDLALMEKEAGEDARDRSGGDDVGTAYEFPLLRELTLKQQRQRRRDESRSWIAHVTLGNLVGGSKEDVRRLSDWLSNEGYRSDGSAVNGSEESSLESNGVVLGSNDDAHIVAGSTCDVLGLALGGPVPGHVALYWDFPFYQPKSS